MPTPFPQGIPFPDFPRKGSPKWQNFWLTWGWYCSRSTKFGTITCQVFRGQAHPISSGSGAAEPQFFHASNLHTPAVFAKAIKFGMVTYHHQSMNFRGWRHPYQKTQKPLTDPKIWHNTIYYQAMNVHDQSPLGWNPHSSKFFTSTVSIIRLYDLVLQYILGWLTTIRRYLPTAVQGVALGSLWQGFAIYWCVCLSALLHVSSGVL